jgi:outer membrane protein TolC
MKKIPFLILFVFFSAKAFAQETDITIVGILPLDTIIQRAVDNSALIQRLTKGQEQKAEEIKIDRKAWTQHIALTAGYNYGNGIISDRQTSANDQTTVFRTSTVATYGVGMSLRLPLSEFTTQKNKVRIKELAIEEIEYLKEDTKNMVVKEVISLYNNLERTLETLKIQTKKLEANEVAAQVTETYFKSGEATIDQYRMIMDVLNSSKIEVQKTKSDAWFFLKSLELLVGDSVTN